MIEVALAMVLGCGRSSAPDPAPVLREAPIQVVPQYVHSFPTTRATAVSPDGDQLLVDDRTTAWLWDLATERILAVFDVPDPDFEIVGSRLTTEGPRLVLGRQAPGGFRLPTPPSTLTIEVWDPTAQVPERVVTTEVPEKESWFFASASLSADGRHVVTGGSAYVHWNLDDDTVRWLDTAREDVGEPVFAGSRIVAPLRYRSGVAIWEPEAAKATVVEPEDSFSPLPRGAAFSPDRRHVAFPEAETGTVWVMAVEDGSVVALKDHRETVRAVAWSPDGRLATGGDDGTGLVWDVPQRRVLARLVGHEGRIDTVRWSGDGTRIATHGHDRTSRLWDVATGLELTRVHDQRAGGKPVSVDARGRMAWLGRRGSVWVAAGSEPRQLGSPDGMSAEQLRFVGEKLVVGGSRRVVVWDGATGRAEATFDAAHWWVSPDGEQLLSTPPLTLRDLGTGEPTVRFDAASGVFGAILPDGGGVVTGASRDIVVWDAQATRVVHRIELEAPARSLHPLANGRFVAIQDEGFQTIDVATGRVVRQGTLEGFEREWIEPLGPLVVGQDAAPLQVLDLGTGALRASIDLQGAELKGTTTSAGRLLAFLDGGAFQVYELGRRTRSGIRGEVSSTVQHGAISPDGDRLVVSVLRGPTRLVDARTGVSLAAHPLEARSVAFSPDGRRYAVGTRDGVHLFEAERGRFLGWLGATRDAWLAVDAAGRFHASEPERAELAALREPGGTSRAWLPRERTATRHDPEVVAALLGASRR